MKQFILIMPDGQNYEISDFEELRQKIKSDGEYVMHHITENWHSELKAVCRNGRTALVYFDEDVFAVSLPDEAKTSEILEHMSIHPLPDGVFLPEETAWTVIREFFETGCLPEDVIPWLEDIQLRHFILQMPDLSEWVSPDLDRLYQKMIADFETCWDALGGDSSASAWYFDGEPDPEKEYRSSMGIHAGGNMLNLCYHSKETGTLLSLFDETRLAEITETESLMEISTGLFLPKELAWTAIREFLETGKASNQIRWMTPDEIPEGGNCAD